MFAKNTSDYLRILGSNPYDKGNTSQICTACISIFDASEELDASTYNLYREKSEISPKIFSKLKVIGKGLSKLTKSDRRDVIKRLPESYSTIHVLFSLKPEEVVTGVKRGDITPSLSIRSAKDYVARVKYPAKFALDGEKGKWGYKQENLFKIVRQQDQVLSEELLLDLKDELRKICTKYGVNIQDANAKGVETLRKQERSEKGVFWRLILEKELDKKMDRTKNRPLPTNRISKTYSTIISIIFMLIGLASMTLYFNLITGLLSLASLLLYTFIYTPLKRVGPIAVFVGAIPGALPPLIGWVAFSGEISVEAIIIFSIQFIWQFPHFWAIAWIYHDDYKKVGFKLLPSKGEKNFNTALNIMTYTLFLIPLGLLPTIFGITGIISGAVAVLCAILFLAQTFKLFKDYSRSSALKIMFGSFIYLPIVQISFILDKI